ncbi:concanavalin A-like lectin/glucanase domain-containing protein [Daedaleopsis nitida]|nr:concanavalin A-like lectin/glucanase domain-containing protein [Daedaleopsis nitida]
MLPLPSPRLDFTPDPGLGLGLGLGLAFGLARSLTFVMAVSFAASATPATAYNIARDFSGSHFFDGWDYYGSWDNLTLSKVWWLNEADATSQKLAYIDDAGRAIIRVDNTTDIPGPETDDTRRNTVRLTTKDFFDYGSLLVFDANHLPYGCSVWPAFWTKGPVWPDNGEIDIMESINLMPDNQMAIHTTEGCFYNNDPTITASNCTAGPGCTVHEQKPNSFGAGFAAAGGGVWATQFDVAGIYIWFWNRADVPEQLNQNTSVLDISSWGKPSASYPVTPECDLTKYFTPQQIVLDIALCGDWAGVDSIYERTCDGTCHVSGPGSPAYDNAYFEINYVRAYTTGPPLPSPTPSSSTTAPATVLTNPPTRTGSSDDSNGARRVGSSAGVMALVASVLGMLLLA